jgi:CheY-like chemotaxis protein
MKLATQAKPASERNYRSLAQRVQQLCISAKQLEKAGEYEAAIEALGEFWPDGRGTTQLEADLDQQTRAELLLRVGSLTGWLGGARQTNGSQEAAKNLITKSIEIFQKLGQSSRLAEADGDLALCYWREGALDEARITLASALNRLTDGEPDLRAILLIRAGIVEMDSRKLNESFRFFNEAKPLVEESENDALKGSFHMGFANLFTRLALPDSREDYFDQALIENTAASFHFEKAGNRRVHARVENNLGFLFFTIGRYQESHKHLDRARQLFLELKDIGAVAQVDDTRARTLLAEGRLKEAERYARQAVKTLEKGDECSLLVEALTTHAIIIARLGNHARARALLQRAIEVAETCGDLEGAGRARLSIIEELSNQTPAEELASIFNAAVDLLQNSQDPSAGKRLIACGLKTIDALLADIEQDELPSAEGSWEDFSFRQEIKKVERRFIERALRDAGGSVSKASRLLGFKHHQSLISMLINRHRDLEDHRSIKRRRRRHLVPKPRREKKKLTPSGRRSTRLSILHVEDHKVFARTIEDLLNAEGIHVDSCATGTAAVEILKTDAHYDALLVDNNLPGLSGLELVLRVRSMPQRRNLPIIMLSADDCEREAWRAGVDAFLRKSESIDQVPSTIARVLEERRKG